MLRKLAYSSFFPPHYNIRVSLTPVCRANDEQPGKDLCKVNRAFVRAISSKACHKNPLNPRRYLMQANTHKINHKANVMPQLHSNARIYWNRASRVLTAFLIALLFAQSASASPLVPGLSTHLSSPFVSEL